MASQAPTAEEGPTPEQIEQMRQAMTAEAARRGMTLEQFQTQQRAVIAAEAKAAGVTPQVYVASLRAKALADMRQKSEANGETAPNSPNQESSQQQRIPINNTGTPDPRALALAQWLRGQELKTRTCILGGERKDMFRGKENIHWIVRINTDRYSSQARTESHLFSSIRKGIVKGKHKSTKIDTRISC